ncbi:MAG: SRPBCC family protein [Nitrospirota bacterium]
MWKWLGGCLLVCVAVVGFGLWQGYRKLSSFGSGDGTETVTIAGPVSRVFASLATSDSLSTWMAERTQAGHPGTLVVGDTLQGESKLRFNVGNKRVKWVVSEVKPNENLALEMRADSSRKLVARRQFTLTAKGDSTQVLSAVSAPMLDSLRTARRDTIRGSDAAIDMTSKLMTSALRMQSHIELERLKARVEGRPMPGGKIP